MPQAVAVACILLLAATLPAFAQVDPSKAGVNTLPSPGSYFVHVGPSGLFPDESVSLKAAGLPIPGTMSIRDSATLAVETGLFLTPDVAVSVTAGIPTISKIEAAGALKGLGTIGKAFGGATSAQLQYHWTGFGSFQPYVGIGPTFLCLLDTEDGFLSRYRVSDAVGVSFQAGADFMLDEHWGLFLDVKRAILRTSSSGYLGPVRVTGNVVLDGTAVHSGVTYRF